MENIAHLARNVLVLSAPSATLTNGRGAETIGKHLFLAAEDGAAKEDCGEKSI